MPLVPQANSDRCRTEEEPARERVYLRGVRDERGKIMDTYQPIFDAVRSKLSNGNIGDAVAESMREAGVAHYVQFALANIIAEVSRAVDSYATPSAIYKPSLSIDGNTWCALYGDNLQDGVAGFGDSPADAMAAFDMAWSENLRALKK